VVPIALHELAGRIGARVVGDGTVRIVSLASIESATPDALVFAQDERRLPQALASAAGAVLTGEFAGAQGVTAKPLLVAANPRLAFARAAAALASGQERVAGVHPNAVVDATAMVGAEVSIAPFAVVEAHARIGAGTRVGAGTHIAGGAVLGSDCIIAANVTIHGCVALGDRVVVQAGCVLGSDGFGYVRDEQGRYLKFPQIGRVEIGDDVEVGAGCTIDRGALDATVIGRGAKLDNLVHVGHNVRIGEDVVIAAQTGISGSVTIGPGAVIGGQVGIGDHVIIEEGVVLGSGSGVLSNKVVRGKGVVFWGTPAKPLRQYLRELATLARLAKRAGSKE
jgi:UDP-3-O-[3-hydroxymyristoyl] glucosamine N-acyltransferase